MALLLCLAVPAFAESLEPGGQAFERGDFGSAILYWQKNPQAADADLLLRQAQAYRYLGRYRDAERVVQDAMRCGETPEQQAAVELEHSILAMASGNLSAAKLALDNANTEEVDDPDLRFRLRNQEAVILSAEGRFEAAETIYREDLSKAPPRLHSMLALNRAENCRMLESEQPDADFACTLHSLELARAASQQQPRSYKSAFALLTLAQQTLAVAQALPRQQAALLDAAEQDLNAAHAVAQAIGNPGAQAHVASAQGRLAEIRGDLPGALRLTRQAVFWGEQRSLPQQSYSWHWQLGRLLAASRDISGAVAAYRKALAYLQPFRFQEMNRGLRRRLSGGSITALYLQFLDALLQQADIVKESDIRQALLEEARQAIEALNLTELQDYFNAPCTAVRTCKHTHLKADTAVVYPLLLPERAVLLLMKGDEIHALSVPVTQNKIRFELIKLAGQLRTPPVTQQAAGRICPSAQRSAAAQTIQTPSQTVLPAAQTLYDRLFKPLEAYLRDVRHLLIIPTGLTRIIPFAALHDGERFLAQRYSFSSTPGLCLADAEAGKPPSSDKTLLAGLTASVQGFSPLPCVSHELDELTQLVGPGRFTRLQDETFTERRMSQTLAAQPQDIVHIASHGQFSDRVEDSFILTYDGRLSLGELENMLQDVSQKPTLLTLSACETALGNDRAALGLAGVAVKAGVHSALAGLWRVDDQATTLLMEAFYRHWLAGGMSKAQALQAAQQAMLAREVYAHPYYWAGFVLIGQAD